MTKQIDLSPQRIQQYLSQYKERVSSLANGDLIIPITRNLRDVFTGEGWHHRRRERLIGGKWVYQRG